jgi:nitroreductase
MEGAKQATNAFIELIKARRTVRQFQPKQIPLDQLKACVDAARLAPSAMNLQPLEFLLITDVELTKKIFPLLSWAAYINPYGDPKSGHEPTAYLITLYNRELRKIRYEQDAAAAIENFILAALSWGIASAWLASVDRAALTELFEISSKYKIDSVVALGYPAEQPVVEKMIDSVQYWKDKQQTLHVPKRALADVLCINAWKKPIG